MHVFQLQDELIFSKYAVPIAFITHSCTFGEQKSI